MYVLSTEKKHAAQILDEISSFSYSASMRRAPHYCNQKSGMVRAGMLITYTVEKNPLLG